MKNLFFFICLVIASGAFGQIEFKIVTVIPANVTCNGAADGTITVTVNGGTKPYTYISNNKEVATSNLTSFKFTKLSPGKYLIAVKDKANTTVKNNASVEISEPAKVNVTCSGTDLKCNGDTTGTLNVTATGGSGVFGFSWSNGSQSAHQSGVPAGTYTVSVSDKNKIDTTKNTCPSIPPCTVTISQPPVLLATASGTNLSCTNNNSGRVTVSDTGGTAPYRHFWNMGPDSISQTQTGLPAGNYIVQVTDANGCNATSSVTITRQGSSGKKYSIGDSTSCGIVFYIDPNDSCSNHYLVCAFKDQDTGISWYNGNYVTTNAVNDGLFDIANASVITGAQGDSAYAANICAKYHPSDSCTGWYLPSKAELELMYTNLVANRAKPLGGFSNEGYWSSLERKKRKAWIVDFFDGRMIVNDKSNKYHVRAVMELKQ